MTPSSMPGRGRTQSLTPEAFEQLLARMGPNRDEAAAEYEKVRRKLFSFFDWRGSPEPEADADETFDRVARKLLEGEKVDHLGRYVYGVARRVLFESHRRQGRRDAALDDWRRTDRSPGREPESERRLACLERCLHELPAESRDLILAYYETPEGSPLERRKRLAEKLGIPYGTLKTRAYRVRGRLDACLEACLGNAVPETEGGRGSPTSEENKAPVSREPEQDADTTGYLLGTLAPQAQERIEERFFEDDAFYEDLLATSDDLIHAYLTGALPQDDRVRFETHFQASPWRRQRIEFMRDLLAAMPRSVRSRTRWLGWAVAASLLMAAIIVAELLRGPGGRDPQQASLSPAPLATASPAPAQTPGPTPTTAAQGGMHTVRVVHGSALPVALDLPPGVRSVRLEVEVERGHLSYDAVVTRNGKRVWSAEELTLSGTDAPLAVAIPADVLSEGEYILTVQGEASRAEARRPPRLIPLRVIRRR